MAITKIDARSALVIIDLQKGILSLPTAHPVGDIVSRASALAAAFRRLGQPVVLVNVAGGAPGRADQPRSSTPPPADWTDLAAELDCHREDHLVTKQTWGAFRNTDLEEHLKGLNVTQVVLAGVATSIGVESTARQAHEAGFNVVLALHAMTDMSAEAHANSASRIFPRLGETGTTADILKLLDSADR